MKKYLFIFILFFFILVNCNSQNKKIKTTSNKDKYKTFYFEQITYYPEFYKEPEKYFPGNYVIGIANPQSNDKEGFRIAKEDAIERYKIYQQCKVRGGIAEKQSGLYSLVANFVTIEPLGEFNENNFSFQDSIKIAGQYFYVFYNNNIKPSESKEINIKEENMPDFFKNPPKDNNFYYGIGICEGMKWSKDAWYKAEERAIGEIAAQKFAKSKSLSLRMDNDFSDDNEKYHTIEYSDIIVSNIKILKRAYHNGKYYVLIRAE